MRFVVDASVAVKWLLPEEHSGTAEKLLTNGTELLVPDLFYAEVANALWKRVIAGEMEVDKAHEALTKLRKIAIRVVPVASVLDEALMIAIEHRRTVYDSAYLAVALRNDALLATADERFFNSMKTTVFKQRVRWIGKLSG